MDEEKAPTTGLDEAPEKNGMGGEEPPKKKRGRPPRKPGDPPGKYTRKTKPTGTIGEYIAENPSVATGLSFDSTRGKELYDSSLSFDEVIARDLDRHLEIMALPRVNLDVLKEVQGRYVDYVKVCRKYGKRLTVAGFAESLGINRQSLWRITTGNSRKPQEVVDFLNAVLASISAELEDLLVTNKINPVSGIFLLKQQGYKDNVDLTINASATEQKSEEELAAEYLESIPTIDDIPTP